MNIEERLTELICIENKDKEIQGIRFLQKVEENKWKFRFTFREGDYLSMSEEFEAEFIGLKLELVKKSIFISPGVFTIDSDSTEKKEKVTNLKNK